jgi:ATP-dependent Clp protease ATP-binding subunit ClpA
VTTEGSTRSDLQGFGADARRALVLAEREARSLGHQRVGTEHLLLGLLADEGAPAAAALRNAGATVAAARRKVSEAVGPGAPGNEPSSTSPRANRALGRAPRFARDQRAELVGSDHLLLAVLDVEGTAGQVLRGLGVDLEHLRSTLGATNAAHVEHRSQATEVSAALRPVCPSCHGAVNELTGTTVPVNGGSDRPVLVVSCPACGAVLGVT